MELDSIQKELKVTKPLRKKGGSTTPNAREAS